MANIPTIQAGESAQTGSISTRAQGSPVGTALVGAGQAISDVSHVGTQLALQQQEKANKLKKLDDIRWANEALNAEQLQIATFMADNANHRAEDFGTRVKTFSAERLAQYNSGAAPSPEAYKLFKTHFANLATQSTVSAINTGANNKIVGIVNSTTTSISSAQESFRVLRSSDPSLAKKNMLNSIAQISASIDMGIGQFDKDVAHKLKEDLLTQSVLNSMTVDPSFARSLLESTKLIDEQTRHTLLQQVNTALKVKTAEERDAFSNLRENQRVMWKTGNSSQEIPIDYYLDHYPELQAQSLKSEDDKDLKVWSEGNAILKAVLPKNAREQQKVLNTLGDSKKWKMDTAKHQEDLYRFVAKQIQDTINQQNTNSTLFLNQYNPYVKQAFDKAKSAQGDAASVEWNNYYNVLLKYQGQPPRDQGGKLLVSEDEAQLYLGRPLADQHLLDIETATKLGDKLNLSKPKEFIKSVAETLAQYPSDLHKNIVFNDLVTKGKINQQYQFAWQNKDQWWIDTYIGAISGGKDLKPDQKTSNEIELKVGTNPIWLSFQSSVIGDNFQRANELAGFKSGVIQFAGALMTQGKSVKEAVNMANSLLINSTLGFTKINDKPLMIGRDRGPGKAPWTDGELSSMGNALSYALQDIPIKSIDQTPFVALRNQSNPDKALSSLSDEINSRGFWQTGPDGKSASLYAIDENGIQAFQVLDNSGEVVNGVKQPGKPFIAYFDEVPRASMTGRRSIFAQKSAQSDKRPTWLKTE